MKFNRLCIFAVSAAIVALVGCGPKKKGPVQVPPKPPPPPVQQGEKPPTPATSQPAPRSGRVSPITPPKVAIYPNEIVGQLFEKNGPAFSEPVSILFSRYGRIFSRHIYVFQKSYLGDVDNRAWFWWQQGDDVLWSTPWEVVSIDLQTMKLIGGTEAGVGTTIGEVHYDGKQFRIEPTVEYSIDKDQQQISFLPPVSTPSSVAPCPQIVSAANMCVLYQGIFDVLSAVDYSAFGAVGPEVARDVINVSTAFKLARSVWSFKPDVDQIRSKYLIPMLKAIGQLKALRKADQSDRGAYLKQTHGVYSNLIVTSLDTVLKSQKMMPEALPSLSNTAFAGLLAYLGAQGVADRRLSKGQPLWFKQVVAPIIREFAALSIDILSNGNQTPMQVRIDRLLAMEEQVKAAIRRLCVASPTSSQNECSDALNN